MPTRPERITPPIRFLFVAPHQHELACHASLPEQLVRLSCLGKGKSLRDQRLDLLLLKEVEQGNQIRPKPCRSQPLQPLNAVGDYPFPAREKPAASDVHPEDGQSMKAMPTPCSQSPPTE